MTTPEAQPVHRCFTVDATAYLRNLDRADLKARCVAVHYQKPPTKTEGGTSIGLRFPMLIVAAYLEEPDAVAAKVADILERHWDEGDQPDAAVPDVSSQIAALSAAVAKARDVFRHYGELHRAKGSQDGDDKATRNEDLAAEMQAALEGHSAEPYLIWSNEHGAWWRAKGAGYTSVLDDAGRYDRAAALATCTSSRDGWGASRVPPEVPVREADALKCQSDWLAKVAGRDEGAAS